MAVTGGLEVVAEGLVALAPGSPTTCITGIVYVADVNKIIPVGDGACVTNHASNGIDDVNPGVIGCAESTALSAAAVGIAIEGERALGLWLADRTIRSHTCAIKKFYLRNNGLRCHCWEHSHESPHSSLASSSGQETCITRTTGGTIVLSENDGGTPHGTM